MSLSDPIADFLTRIRNAQAAEHYDVEARYSGTKESIARILKQEGYVSGYEVKNDKTTHPTIVVQLKYVNRVPAIRGVQRVSKPGLRQYVGAGDVPRVLEGLGVAILSTSSGVMPDSEARDKGVGGEVLCQVW